MSLMTKYFYGIYLELDNSQWLFHIIALNKLPVSGYWKTICWPHHIGVDAAADPWPYPHLHHSAAACLHMAWWQWTGPYGSSISIQFYDEQPYWHQQLTIACVNNLLLNGGYVSASGNVVGEKRLWALDTLETVCHMLTVASELSMHVESGLV